MTQFGWVIEHKDSPVETPQYWSGEVNPFSWTANSYDAIRFARELDARRFANKCFDRENSNHRFCEHGWD